MGCVSGRRMCIKIQMMGANVSCWSWNLYNALLIPLTSTVFLRSPSPILFSPFFSLVFKLQYWWLFCLSQIKNVFFSLDSGAYKLLIGNGCLYRFGSEQIFWGRSFYWVFKVPPVLAETGVCKVYNVGTLSFELKIFLLI